MRHIQNYGNDLMQSTILTGYRIKKRRKTGNSRGRDIVNSLFKRLEEKTRTRVLPTTKICAKSGYPEDARERKLRSERENSFMDNSTVQR